MVTPEFHQGLVTDADISGNYEYDPHGGKWNTEGTTLAGRGVSSISRL